ncbi:antibiotic biosynthesis monooxygenase [Pseudarthrobacter psychrotolerans]|uniref:Antibiotic biosynthesis monooxygenase n=1 Tax=Pseudarthrobacter psychrotolerans TaxID=2697569 RepID=A0A6P1NI67_9MICC|nr:antibiotic biosynthesis monooxygenase [Pseudarthrobacter psychrotolerans]QHK19048.1 antibiotic biosynthesis monooxygenase [Pseudarthrobacter psychrotolerans]
MSETYFLVVVRYQVKPEETETVLGLLGEMAAATRAEEANISYEFFQGVEDPAQIVVLERYADAAGFAAHREYEHIERIGAAQIIPRLARRTIQTFDVRADS